MSTKIQKKQIQDNKLNNHKGDSITKHECGNIGKQKQDNIYMKHTGDSVKKHKDAEHLSKREKGLLSDLMSQFEGLPKGTVEYYTEMEVIFEANKDSTPYHAKPYRVTVAQTPLMKRAIDEMVKNKALAIYNGDSEWASPAFGVPNKNEGVRIVTDFRNLNEAIKRNQWPMPTIQDMLHQCGGMTYATALDMIMSYYAMDVKKEMQKYLVIIYHGKNTSIKRCLWGCPMLTSEC